MKADEIARHFSEEFPYVSNVSSRDNNPSVFSSIVVDLAFGFIEPGCEGGVRSFREDSTTSRLTRARKKPRFQESSVSSAIAEIVL